MPSPASPDAFDGYYATARRALVDLLEPAWQPQRILDLGCGSGATLALLKQRFPQARTVGVESLPAAAAQARRQPGCEEVIEADLLDPMLDQRLEVGFDLVVLSHVIEHVADPGALLRRVRRWVAKGGRLLVALPNVRHVSVVLPLVFRGDFRYREAGVLDATHLRFFTRRSAVRLFEANGLQVLHSRAEVGGRGSWAFHLLTLGLARDFAAFAHNFVLREAPLP